MEDWSNNACLGYAIMGAKVAGLSEKQIQALVDGIRGKFDWKTVKEAADVFCKSPY